MGHRGGWRVLTSRPARWIGERSYGLYLIHLGLMGHIMQRIGESHSYPLTFAVLALVALGASLLAADLIWRFVERPALSWRLPWRQAEFAGSAPDAPRGSGSRAGAPPGPRSGRERDPARAGQPGFSVGRAVVGAFAFFVVEEAPPPEDARRR